MCPELPSQHVAVFQLRGDEGLKNCSHTPQWDRNGKKSNFHPGNFHHFPSWKGWKALLRLVNESSVSDRKSVV